MTSVTAGFTAGYINITTLPFSSFSILIYIFDEFQMIFSGKLLTRYITSQPSLFSRVLYDSTSRFVRPSVGWSVGPLIRRSIGPSISQSVSPSVRCSIGQSVCWSVSQLVGRSVSWSVGKLVVHILLF